MNNKLNYLNWRFILIAVAIFICLIAIIYKMFSIQFFESNFLQNEGNKRYVKYKDVVPRPNHWSGWNLKPSSFEFWLDGENRIHERLKYILEKNNNWSKSLLSP